MKHLFAAAALLLAATPAFAGDLSFNTGLSSEYVSRGTSQTWGQPGYSLGAEYSTDNGFYVGAWTANVDFHDGTDEEVDLYGGYRTTVADWNLDLGVATYNYTGAPVNYNMVEALATVSREFGRVGVSAQVAYTPDYFNVQGESLWVEGTVGYRLTDKLAVSAGAGRQDFLGRDGTYSTGHVGATYSVSDSISVDVRYYDTDRHDLGYLYEDRVAAALNVAF